MRVLIQVVKDAKVSIDQQVVATIGKGLVYFVGFSINDDNKIVDRMVDKLVKLRIFSDENGKTNLNIVQVAGTILSISQFTLYGDVKGGNRPSFVHALAGQDSEKLYDYFNEKLRDLGYDIKTGVFGADMEVNLTNTGPFTLLLDSEELYG